MSVEKSEGGHIRGSNEAFMLYEFKFLIIQDVWWWVSRIMGIRSFEHKGRGVAEKKGRGINVGGRRLSKSKELTETWYYKFVTTWMFSGGSSIAGLVIRSVMRK